MRELGLLNVTANRPTRLTTQWAWGDGDDEEDGDSEGDDDYDFDNQSTGTVRRQG